MRQTNESGRSMVEMLGVLAIIGVLSIGGIAGYVLAMRRHMANETANQIMMASVILQTGQIPDEDIRVGQYAEVIIGDDDDPTADAIIKANPERAPIKVNVDKEACPMLKRLLADNFDIVGETNCE